jgi:hypothetical protein
MSYFAVTREHGSAWNASLPMKEQKQWTEQAVFMNKLVDQGFVILGGPLGDGLRTLLIVNSDSEKTIEAVPAADPWTKMRLLAITNIERYEVLLERRGEAGASP